MFYAYLSVAGERFDSIVKYYNINLLYVLLCVVP